MDSRSDQQLLADYAGHGDEAAFSELVRRHVGLVYGAAHRLVLDHHLAQDAAQAVFVALAANARKLADRSVLSGWLHVTTRNFSVKAIRSQIRRRDREKEAAAMPAEPDDAESAWEQLAPHLDHALGSLNEADRDALLLRFFERRNAREIGERLGIAEEAAQKRVARALERLRDHLGQRRLQLSVSSLAGALAAGTLLTAPDGLAGVIATQALATSAAAAFSTTTLVTLLTMTKMKLGIIIVALVACLATPLILLQRANASRQMELAALNQQTQELEQLRQENEQLTRAKVDPAELRQLRDENAALLRKSKPLIPVAGVAGGSAKNPSGQGGLKDSEEFVSRDAWRDQGAGTPADALESLLSAGLRQGFAKARELIHFEQPDSALPEAQLTSAMDRAVSAFLAGMTNLQAIRVLNTEDVVTSEDPNLWRKTVTFQSTTADGKKPVNTFQFSFRDGSWGPVMTIRPEGDAGWAGYAGK